MVKQNSTYCTVQRTCVTPLSCRTSNGTVSSSPRSSWFESYRTDRYDSSIIVVTNRFFVIESSCIELVRVTVTTLNFRIGVGVRIRYRAEHTVKYSTEYSVRTVQCIVLYIQYAHYTVQCTVQYSTVLYITVCNPFA